ncbi:MAG: hypothetical protein HY235_25780 [Acidobacteria bacterium]|nr:hypothetical protein [Acidobacteriota bacterium]
MRVLRPGGTLLLAETYGDNGLLNVARRLRAWLAGEAEEQGEGIILGSREIRLLETCFARVEIEGMNLLAMAKRLLRGLETADAFLIPILPASRRYCGEALITAVK